MTPDLLISYDAVGLMGVACYIMAYASLQLRLLRGTDYTYTGMNLTAATLVLISLSNNFNLSSAIIQVSWIGISLFGIGWTLHRHHSTRLSEEEADFVQAKFPLMTKPMARRFLDAGLWIDGDPGTAIAEEGEAMLALVYLKDGTAEVSLSGKIVGACRPGVLIGELSCFDRSPATATVTLTAPSRYFLISSDALERLCATDSDLRIALESTITSDMRVKFQAVNERLSMSSA